MLASFDLAGHVIGVIIDRDITEKVIEEIVEKIEDKIKIHDHLNIFVELEKGYHISFNAFMKGLKFKYANDSHFDKIAIVTDRFWFQNAVKISEIILNAEMRTFELKDRIEAIQWISL